MTVTDQDILRIIEAAEPGTQSVLDAYEAFEGHYMVAAQVYQHPVVVSGSTTAANFR